MTSGEMGGFVGSKVGWVLTFTLAALGAYLIWNHTDHVVLALPYLFLLACPLLHLLGHSHRHHGQGGQKR